MGATRALRIGRSASGGILALEASDASRHQVCQHAGGRTHEDQTVRFWVMGSFPFLQYSVGDDDTCVMLTLVADLQRKLIRSCTCQIVENVTREDAVRC